MTVVCCKCLPHRYFIVMMCFIGMLISVAYRTSFALVVTHITAFNGTNSSTGNTDSLFPNCTTEGTNRDKVVVWDGSTTLLFNTFYFVGQAIFSLPGGTLAQRISAKWVFGSTILLSSVLQLFMTFVLSWDKIEFIYFYRFVQGAVEAVTAPSLNAVISPWAPKTQRSRLINLAYAGVYLSPAVANFSTGACVCYLSWDSIFYILGGAGVVWTVFFFLFAHSTPDQHPCLCDSEKKLFLTQDVPVKTVSAKKIPWCKIFSSMPVWATFVAAFCRNFVFAMLITEVQQYYKDVYRLNSAMNGLLNGLPHIFMVIFMIFGSHVFDYLGKKNILSWTNVRKLAQTLGFGVMGICILAIGFVDSYKVSTVLFCIGVAFSGFSISGYQTNPLDLAPKFVGPITGISRTGMIGSILSTILTAKTAGESHSLKDWSNLFIAGGSLHIAGVIFYCIFASGQLQPWAVEEYEALIPDSTVQGSGIDSSRENSDSLIAPTIKKSNYGALQNEIY